MLVIQPYDKTSIPNIEKAIMSSDLGLTPGNDGNLIRINVPQLTAVSHFFRPVNREGMYVLLTSRVSWHGQKIAHLCNTWVCLDSLIASNI